MALPVDVNFAILPTYRRGVGMGFRIKVSTTDYDPAEKLVEFKIVNSDDASLSYETDSEGAYVTAFPAAGGNPPYVIVSVPSSVLVNVAKPGSTSDYGIDFRADSGSDPDFRLQGFLFWTDDVGDPPV